MVATWPPGVDWKILAAGFSIGGDPKGRIGSQTDVGPGKQRRRAALRTKDFRGTAVIPAAQFPTFEAFYETTLKEGVLPFQSTHPKTGATLRLRFPPGKIPGYEPQLERGGKNYLVALELQVLP